MRLSGVTGRTANHIKEASDRQGKLGGMLAAGEVVLTATGRRTSPFPRLDFSTTRRCINTVKRVDTWLMDNAAAEARARGNEFAASIFEANRLKPSQSDKDSAEMVLFDADAVEPLSVRATRLTRPMRG